MARVPKRGRALRWAGATSWAVLAIATGCSSDAVLWIDLRTDLVPGSEFDGLVVTIDGEEVTRLPAPGADYLEGHRLGAYALPPGTHLVRVAVARGRTTVLARQQRVAVVRTTVLPVWLVRSCLDVTCPSGGVPETWTECENGGCVEPDCAAEGSCPDGCGSDAECPPPLAPCARAVCLERHCVAAPVAGACAPSAYCDPEVGCTPRLGADAGAGDAGASDAGVGPDAPASGCTTDGECPPPSYGGWSGCGYADGCDESGTRRRDVTRHVCMSGACVPVASTEDDACTRSTEGDVCGTESSSPTGACSYGSSCAESGSQPMRTTRYNCAGGSCRAWDADWSRPCTRSTAGSACTFSAGCPGTCAGGYCDPECRPGCPC